MGNEITTTTARQVTTPAGALALRQIMCSAAAQAIDCDEDQARGLLSPAVRDLLPSALEEAGAWLAPAIGRDFKRTVAPTLSLVAPAGMSEGDQRAWLATAAETLSGMPADLLERGCVAARRVVDHPAKIVPAIFANVQREWDRRRAVAGKLARLMALGDTLPPPPPEYVSPEAAAAILKEVGIKTDDDEARRRQVHRGPPRRPNDADMVTLARDMGVSLGACEGPVANIQGLSISEIFQQRDYALGADIEAEQSA